MMDIQRCKSKHAGKPILNRRLSRSEIKLALLEDVDRLKKKLKQEENVHRALERAFSRRLGTLPHLPPYLPPQTLELLAEVAVLEEEVVRLEEEVVSFRQGLYQEAAYLSSRININSDDNSLEQSVKTGNSDGSKSSMSSVEVHSEPSKLSQQKPLNSLSRSASSRLSYSHRIRTDFLNTLVDKKPADLKKSDSAISDDGVLGKENRSSSNSNSKIKNSPESIAEEVQNLVKIPQIKFEIDGKHTPPKPQNRLVDQERAQESCSSSSSGDRILEAESECNKISENVLKCLIDFRKKTNASLLIRRLKLLLEKLSSLNLEGLTHQQKLAFWINTYNICMMNAYLEHGIPEDPEMMPTLIQKATINAGGYLLNAITIEHYILRLPNHSKLTCPQSTEENETEIRDKYGLEWSEPLVTFALCSGSWSSPVVRVYTSANVENELATAKREYLQAAFGITKTNKLVIPDMLDWCLLDFGKDLEALVEWVCLQLPSELRKQAVTCLEKRGREPISKKVQIMSYDYRFRYLIQR